MTRVACITILMVELLMATWLLSPSVCRGGDVLHGVHVPNCVCKRCCDDYCRKPMPRACGVKCFCYDDYCAKPEPCATCVQRYCCDDYVPKCLPRALCPPGANLKCPPRSTNCASRAAAAVPTVKPVAAK